MIAAVRGSIFPDLSSTTFYPQRSAGYRKIDILLQTGRQMLFDSLTIGDMKDKAGPEKLQGYWILELSRLAE